MAVLLAAWGAAPSRAAQAAYALSPSSVPAGQAFDLKLLGGTFGCATAFDQVSAILSDGKLILYFHDTELPKGCGDTSHTYGPVFHVPALAAGIYPVKASRLQMNDVADAGSLVVTGGPARTDWYLKDRIVPEGQPFALQLLRDDVGNCHTIFSHETLNLVSGSLYASFVMTTDPDVVCIVDIRPFGPHFPAPALEPGIYPVLPQELMPCQVAQPACLLPVKVPTPTDTLVVTHTLSLRMSDLRAGAPRAEVQGNAAVFRLPEGAAGVWHTELTTLDGRRLGVAWLRGTAGDRVSVPLDRAPTRTVTLLRLISPDGAASLIPIVR
jgi:hypothetical protein